MRATQHALDDLNEFSAHHLRLQLADSRLTSNNSNPAFTKTPSHTHLQQSDSEDVALRIKLLPQDASRSPKAVLQPHSTLFAVYYTPSQVPSTSSGSSPLANFIATQLQGLFAEEEATIAYILTSHSAGHQSSMPSISQQTPATRDHRTGNRRTLQPDLASRLASRMTRSLKYAPIYHITISLFTPLASPSAWDIEDSLKDYFEPLLKSVSQISNFTIDTQIQLHATFSNSVQQPEHDPNLNIWTLREEDLSGFINAAEWPLSPSIGAGPSLNFVLYVPDPANAPLVVKGSQATSWLIPQWGGVTILNPPELGSNAAGSPIKLSKTAIQPALLTFSQQLLSFLGASQSPSSLPLQLRTLTRVRVASLLLSASATMGSLARLTVALPSIAIPEAVSDGVEKTIVHLRGACDALKEGKFREALEKARVAEIEAEKCFFEKSMVGQVYFPDEHKVAVYLPLLGPVGVPLVMSALKELKRFWSTFKEKLD